MSALHVVQPPLVPSLYVGVPSGHASSSASLLGFAISPHNNESLPLTLRGLAPHPSVPLRVTPGASCASSGLRHNPYIKASAFAQALRGHTPHGSCLLACADSPSSLAFLTAHAAGSFAGRQATACLGSAAQSPSGLSRGTKIMLI